MTAQETSPTAVATAANLEKWIGRTVLGRGGDEIGELADLYLDDRTGRADWITIKAGWFGRKRHFVPAGAAEFGPDSVLIPYSKDHVEAAPSVDDDNDHLSATSENILFNHYGVSPRSGDATSAPPGDQGSDARIRGSAVDGSLVRSEEELHVDTVDRPAGVVRLRKYVVTEDVNMTVPVRHEVAHVVREPAPDDTGVIDTSESEEVIVLREEQIEIDKRVVAKERVGIETDVVTDHESIEGTVRKERIEIDESEAPSR